MTPFRYPDSLFCRHDGVFWTNGGASFCCPLGNCTEFDDPGMSFDFTLLDIESDADRTAIVNWGFDPTGTLGNCEGDCDYDSDCPGDLVCFQRDYGDEYPPGCTGTMMDLYDYCYDPSWPFGDVQYISANNTAQLLETAVNCTEEVCVVRCQYLLSCAFSTFSVGSNETIIECDGQFSCLSAFVIATEWTDSASAVVNELSDHNVTILCLGL